MGSSTEVRPLGGNRYGVRKARASDGWALTYFEVTYQPSDRWKPEIVWCNCGEPGCSHVAAVVEFRRQGEG